MVRAAAAVTLMWTSVEEWAYHPEWTAPLLAAKAAMTFGASPEVFMKAAGGVALTLALALIRTPLVRRTAAIVLAAIFVSAVFEFGKLDAIGHSGIIVVLVAIVADDARAAVTRRDVALAPARYGVSLAGFRVLYHVGHSVLYGALSKASVVRAIPLSGASGPTGAASRISG